MSYSVIFLLIADATNYTLINRTAELSNRNREDTMIGTTYRITRYPWRLVSLCPVNYAIGVSERFAMPLRSHPERWDELAGQVKREMLHTAYAIGGNTAYIIGFNYHWYH